MAIVKRIAVIVHTEDSFERLYGLHKIACIWERELV